MDLYSLKTNLVIGGVLGTGVQHNHSENFDIRESMDGVLTSVSGNLEGSRKSLRSCFNGGAKASFYSLLKGTSLFS